MTLGEWCARERAGALPGPARSRMLLHAFFALLLSGGVTAAAEAQQTGRVTGVVVDSASRAPLAGVQVYLERSTLGALTRQNGRYIISNIPPGRYQLRAERIGMTLALRDITVEAGATVEADFALEIKALGLDEIVVTGTAGAARRREIGNSITQINVANLPQRPVDVSSMLQASAPGIEVTNGGAGAGQGSKVRLRGSKSLEMGSDPIIYIDGVRMMTGAFPVQAAKDQGNRAANVTQSPLDMINPNDIERIEVIKGSAATTLYGTEASAGVIQVFTKKGSQGAPVWSLEMQQGTQWSQRFGAGDLSIQYPGGVRGTSAYVYMDPWICTGFLKCGKYMSTTMIRQADGTLTPKDMGGPAHTQMYAASVRGGGQQLQYFTSGELFDERGNTPNDNIKKWSARSNFTYSPTSVLQLQWNNAYMQQDQSNSAQGNNAEGLELNVFRQNGNYFTNRADSLINRVFDQTLSSEIERFTTGLTATYSPVSNLSNRVTVGYDFSNQDTRNIRPFTFFAHPEGIIHASTWQKRIITLDYVGSYQFDLLSSVRSNFSWGGQAVGDEMRQIEGYGTRFAAEEPTLSSASTVLGYEDRSKLWNAGFFLQNIFDISNKYFLTLGMRVDGNSAFGEGFGLQVYPKASASWVVSDEGFWRESWGALKLRTAYGRAGRAPGAFDAARTWTNSGLAGDPAFSPANFGRRDLGPEVTGEFEAGADGSWFDDRVRVTYTYYHQLTKDALIDVNQIPSLGFTGEQLTNVGEIENKGQELSVEFTPLRRANWGFDLGVNLSTNHSKVLSHIDTVNVGKPVLYSLHTLIRHPDAVPPSTVNAAGITVYNLAVCNDDPADATPDTPAGVPCRLLDQFRGSNLPTHVLSGFTTLRLPYGISVSARGEYRGGHYFTGFSAGPIAIGRGVRSPVCQPHYGQQHPDSSSTYLKPGTPALWVARCTSTLATGYSMDADYFKLRSLSVNIPVDFAFPSRIQNSTLTLALGNLYTWSRESLFGTYGIETFGNAGVTDETASTGIATNERIPPTTTFRASLRVTF